MVLIVNKTDNLGLYMAAKIPSGNIPKRSWTATLKESFTLKGRFRNTFTPNSENHALTDKVEFLYRTATLERLQKKKDHQDTSYLQDRAKTLGRIIKGNSKVSSAPLTALEQARQRFACPEDFNTENTRIPPQETLVSKDLNKVMEGFYLAKRSFQNKSYKDAKKRFKKILQKSLCQQRTIIELYLATVYLLQDNAPKAKKYLEGKPKLYAKGDSISFTQIMYSHVSYLIIKKETPEKIRGPCLISQLYKKAECFSEDEKIMAKELCKKFCITND